MIPDLRRSAAAAAAALQQHSSWFLIKVISGLCHFLQVKTLSCLTHSSRSWTQKPLPGGLMTLLQPNEEVIPTRADIRSLNKHTVHVVTPTYTADTFFYVSRCDRNWCAIYQVCTAGVLLFPSGLDGRSSGQWIETVHMLFIYFCFTEIPSNPMLQVRLIY